MCTGGSDVESRPLPSLVTSTTVPVSAMAKLQPVMPTSARRNDSRSWARANAVSSAAVSSSSRPATRENSSRTSPWVLWMIGAMTWLGRSPSSWTTYSPRSVSTTSMPAASSAGLSSISSLSIDFDFTARRAPASLQMPTTMRFASAASAAKCTCVPAASQASANCATRAGRFATAWLRMSRPRRRIAGRSSGANRCQRCATVPSTALGMACRWNGLTSCSAARSSNVVPRQVVGHGSASASSDARWIVRTCEPVRDSRPPRCSRQPPSPDTSASTSAAATSASLESAIATDTSG